jgi:hypothetical protein
MTPDLRAFFKEDLEPMVALLRDLIAIESPTTDKAAVDRMGARVADELASIGRRGCRAPAHSSRRYYRSALERVDAR